jgi:hypothetical protein
VRVAAALVALALGGLGCGSTSTYHIVTGAPGRPSRNDPRLFLVGATLPSNYAEVAIVQAVGHGSHADLDHALEGLRAEAATLGCDAVISTRSDRGETQVSATGVAVRWTDGPAPTPAMPRTPSPWTSAPAAIVAPWATPAP